jgi:hypothetical protein
LAFLALALFDSLPSNKNDSFSGQTQSRANVPKKFAGPLKQFWAKRVTS